VRNWVHIVAEALGLPAADAYRDWRKGRAPDLAAIERAGAEHFDRLVAPELAKPAPA
jgi:hypothetical protein